MLPGPALGDSGQPCPVTLAQGQPNSYMQTHILTSTHTHACTYKHTCTCIHTCLHVCTCINTCACTHIPLPSGSRWVWQDIGGGAKGRKKLGSLSFLDPFLPGVVWWGWAPHPRPWSPFPALCPVSLQPLLGTRQNAHSQAPPTPTEPEAGPSGDSDVHVCLRTTAFQWLEARA